MDVVLDLDLDFFVWPITHWPQWSGRMPSTSVERLASAETVRHFLERQCHLTRTRRIQGRSVITHDQAFYTWLEWIRDGTLRAPFRVIHVDAHADFGLGDGGYLYLLTELLASPVEQRSNPRAGPDALNEGNYLTFAVANRWISDLLYVFPTEPEHLAVEREKSRREWQDMMGLTALDMAAEHEPPPADDLLNVHFHQCNSRTKRIELKQYATKTDASDAAGRMDRCGNPIRYEPQVPYDAMPSGAFEATGFTHLVLAQSPRYTPEAADALMPVILEYMKVG